MFRDFLSSRSIFSTSIRSSDFDGFWCICTVREVHIVRSVRSRNFGFLGLGKSENFCEKMIFAKITLFFVGSFWVEMLRLAHSFGLWGCLGHSKRCQFDENPMDLTRIPMDLGRILFIKSYQIHRIFIKLTTLRVSQAPHSPKLCAKRSISTQKLPTKKNVIFAKIIFRRNFHFFRDLKIQKFEI